MKTKFLLSAALALTLMLAACAPKAAKPTKQSVASTAIPPVVSKPTNTPTKAIAPTATKIPTTVPTKAPAATATGAAPQVNDITVKDQAINSGSVLVSLVDAEKPGWVAIFTDNNGQPGTLLGYTAIPAGKSNDVKVTIDTKKAADKMIAMLLVDEGTLGTFEYPDKDVPVMNASVKTNVMAIFNRLTTSS